jgi:hypothetical protein
VNRISVSRLAAKYALMSACVPNVLVIRMVVINPMTLDSAIPNITTPAARKICRLEDETDSLTMWDYTVRT